MCYNYMLHPPSMVMHVPLTKVDCRREAERDNVALIYFLYN